MIRLLRVLVPVLCVPFVSVPAMAQSQAHGAECKAEAKLPPELSSWRSPVPLAAAVDDKAGARANLTPGKAAELTLRPVNAVRFPVEPGKRGEAGSHAGLASFEVREAGKWRVALGAGAWVDVVRGGEAAASVAHGHGPACTGVRKMVDYDLQPGRYTLLLATSPQDKVTVLVTRLP